MKDKTIEKLKQGKEVTEAEALVARLEISSEEFKNGKHISSEQLMENLKIKFGNGAV